MKVTSATGGPTLPDTVASVPIVITDSLSNAEACRGYSSPVVLEGGGPA